MSTVTDRLSNLYDDISTRFSDMVQSHRDNKAQDERMAGVQEVHERTKDMSRKEIVAHLSDRLQELDLQPDQQLTLLNQVADQLQLSRYPKENARMDTPEQASKQLQGMLSEHKRNHDLDNLGAGSEISLGIQTLSDRQR